MDLFVFEIKNYSHLIFSFCLLVWKVLEKKGCGLNLWAWVYIIFFNTSTVVLFMLRDVKCYRIGSSPAHRHATIPRRYQPVQWTPITISLSQSQSINCTRPHAEQIRPSRPDRGRSAIRLKRSATSIGSSHHSVHASVFRHPVRHHKGHPGHMPTVENSETEKRRGWMTPRNKDEIAKRRVEEAVQSSASCDTG